MNEEFLHYIWQHKLHKKNYTAVTGEKIQVLLSGEKNYDAGPDFQNARVKIDDTIWAGNVEIHTDSANWDQHKHHLNPAYNNVILHVVSKSTKKACRMDGQIIPTIELDYDPVIYNNYNQLVESTQSIACQEDIHLIDNFILSSWLHSLCIERLEQKSKNIQLVFEQTGSNWEETYYILLARSFGFKTNADPFEMLAKSLPLKILLKNKNNLLALEALLFGQAGFLKRHSENTYYVQLKKEYDFLRKAHNLKSIDNHLWKFMRLRPANFPTIRIAQIANLIFNTNHLFSKTMEAQNFKDLLTIYDCKASEFWDNHYNFRKGTKKKEKRIGKIALYNIIINTIIPFLFVYGQKWNKHNLQEKAIALLEEIPFENNAITRSWKTIGIEPKNAFQSQALIQLKTKYCNLKNCLFCQLGNSIICKKLK
jgi:hypothetical protein